MCGYHAKFGRLLNNLTMYIEHRKFAIGAQLLPSGGGLALKTYPVPIREILSSVMTCRRYVEMPDIWKQTACFIDKFVAQ